MALNEGERQALLTQVTNLIDATEVKIRRLGLPHINVGLFDERTRQPIGNPQHLIDMAEGKPLPVRVEPDLVISNGPDDV
jgi:hypothetical protein